MTDQEISEQATEYVRQNYQKIIEKFADGSYKSETVPVSLFMAGSPGAGKTELSKALIDILGNTERYGKDARKVVRIDPDEIRKELPGYNGKNSSLFQKAISKAVDKIHDHALSNRQNFILDSTFCSSKYKENVERSLHDNRLIYIAYVYQDPLVAWEVTKKREKVEGRNIPKPSFIDQFFASKGNVNEIKRSFGEKVTIILIERNAKSDEVKLKVNVDNIDNYIKIGYTRDDLEKLLK